MFFTSFIIFIIILLFTIFAIKKKWYTILFFIAIIAFLAPLYSLYQTGVHTDWRFIGDGLWTRVIFFIILDVPSLIILGVLIFKLKIPSADQNTKIKLWMNKSIPILFYVRLTFHAIELVMGG